MFKNLQNALKENNYSLKFVSNLLGVQEEIIINKINEVNDFTFTEYIKLCALLNRYSPSWLFQNDTGERSA